MSQALYRKYRPKTFDEVYGQGNIVKILKNQIENNKISHAYIFSGTRGTGKTSCAKIFSRAVNCLNPQNGNPCNECENCKAVLNESTMDVIEMDAASNRRIDDIRQLRDKVIYPPTDLKYKVYIIDEAHMITTEGFNALLKIMEEPPKHLIFILATTELDKIPDTILSRVQRFEFKKIEENVIESRIQEILAKENIQMDQDSINTISTIGKGSMRDALSVLDQVVSIDQEDFSIEKVSDILGIITEKTKLAIVDSLIREDRQELINICEIELDKGKDSFNFIKELISIFERFMSYKVGRDKEPVSETFSSLEDKLSLDRVINSLDILVEYEKLMKKSDNRNLLLKMALLRLVDYIPRENLLKKVEALEEKVYRLETKSIHYSPQTNMRSKEKDSKKEGKVDLSKKDFFETFKDDLQEPEENSELVENDSNERIEKVEKTDQEIKDVKNEESSKEANIEEKEEEVKQETKTADLSNLEREIRGFALKAFPSSQTLYQEVLRHNVKNNTLTYWVTEKGMTFAKIMSHLFKKTENEYFRQKNVKIEIKFLEDKTSNEEVLEPVDKNLEKINKIKEFFGEENTEIIE